MGGFGDISIFKKKKTAVKYIIKYHGEKNLIFGDSRRFSEILGTPPTVYYILILEILCDSRKFSEILAVGAWEEVMTF
jgi:hypothetical protein